jgi:Bacterial regulatory helix-turn-helix protein, lysR family
MELRQLRYFVAVADELHFGRAAERLHISGPALSQQILALERDLGAELFVRDRRSVRLTEPGRCLLEDARNILALADGAEKRIRRRAAEVSTLRLGYVSWLPDNLDAVVDPAVALRIDEWVLPSHAQADRVAEGSLDMAIAWITEQDSASRGLTAHLIRAERLEAIFPGASSTTRVPASQVSVLIDSDGSAWSSWNRFVAEFATRGCAHCQHRRRRHRRGGVLRACSPDQAAGARITQTPHSGHPTQFGAPSRRRSDAGVDVVAVAPCRRRPPNCPASCRGAARACPQPWLDRSPGRALLDPER